MSHSADLPPQSANLRYTQDAHADLCAFLEQNIVIILIASADRTNYSSSAIYSKSRRKYDTQINLPTSEEKWPEDSSFPKVLLATRRLLVLYKDNTDET